LHERWRGLFGGDAEEAFAEVVLRYGEPTRRYHTLDHVAAVLATIDRLTPGPSRPLLLAGWFHDLVYDSKAGDNEERSALEARRILAALGVPDQEREETARLILLTKGHTAGAEDADGQLLLDADLAILAADPAVYDEYAKAIREEYSWVGEADYRAGCRRVLEGFLARPRLYFTPTMQEVESQARANLAREVASLS
jgi:predicted metal-dependent HD superfamily phosphohydrolase